MLIESMSILIYKFTLHLLTKPNASVTVLLFSIVNESEVVPHWQGLEKDRLA